MMYTFFTFNKNVFSARVSNCLTILGPPRVSFVMCSFLARSCHHGEIRFQAETGQRWFDRASAKPREASRSSAKFRGGSAKLRPSPRQAARNLREASRSPRQASRNLRKASRSLPRPPRPRPPLVKFGALAGRESQIV